MASTGAPSRASSHVPSPTTPRPPHTRIAPARARARPTASASASRSLPASPAPITATYTGAPASTRLPTVAMDDLGGGPPRHGPEIPPRPADRDDRERLDRAR